MNRFSVGECVLPNASMAEYEIGYEKSAGYSAGQTQEAFVVSGRSVWQNGFFFI